MAKQTGRQFLVKIGDGADPEVFSTLCGINSKTLSINNNTFDVTTADCTAPGGQLWTEVMTGARSVTLSGSGLFEDSTAEERLRAVTLGTGASDTADATATFQVIAPDFGTFEGTFHVNQLDYGAEIEGGVTFSISLQSSGAVTFTAA